MVKARIDKKSNKIWFLLFLGIWCTQMFTAFYFCCQKQGFHEDEYYTYYSTGRTSGLMINDGAWMERDEYFNEFVVLKGEGFQYGLVKEVQSWDVHPPVYYWIFHTVCSLFPGRFSKWFGLVINLASFGVSLFLLRILAMQVTGRNEKLSLLICFFYGFTPAAMSIVVFIRMYSLLTVFVYLCAILHIKAIEGCDRPDKGIRALSFKGFLLPIAVVTYLGFLTQYYYFIFLFFMAAAFCIYLLWKERNLWNCVRYGVSLAVSFALAYLTYPSCLGQMFRGQRGAEAAHNFFDLSNTITRLRFFWQLLDEYVFGNMLTVFLLLLFCLIAAAIYRKRKSTQKSAYAGVFRKNNRAYLILFFTVAGYFPAVSKTALMLGNTSIRYQYPVYGMAVLLVFAAIGGNMQACLIYDGEKDKNERAKKLVSMAAVIICIFINASGLLAGRVTFLYPEDKERIDYARERAMQDVPVVCLYDDEREWCVWDCADEFFEYDRIYFAACDAAEPIEDAAVAGAGSILVYLSNAADTEGQLKRIQRSNPNLTEYEMKWQEKFYTVYCFYQ